MRPTHLLEQNENVSHGPDYRSMPVQCHVLDEIVMIRTIVPTRASSQVREYSNAAAHLAMENTCHGTWAVMYS